MVAPWLCSVASFHKVTRQILRTSTITVVDDRVKEILQKWEGFPVLADISHLELPGTLQALNVAYCNIMRPPRAQNASKPSEFRTGVHI